MSAIAQLFLPLDRCGPGDRASLNWALAVAGTPRTARVLDAGCGTGADLAALIAAVPDGQVVAVDTAPLFIDRVRARFPQVQAEVADMANPPGGPFDLIWSAGAAYNLGLVTALGAWRGHLAPSGRVAVSDLRWTGGDRPAAAVDFCEAEGLDLTDGAAMAAEIAQSGYRLLGTQWLSRSAWAAYYDPLSDALAGCPDDDLVTSFQAEIALWRVHGDSYGYLLCVVEPDLGWRAGRGRAI